MRLLPVLVLLALGPSAGAQAPRPLTPGVLVQDSLAPGERHVYAVPMRAGQVVAGEADQQTADVALRVTDPRGDNAGAFDGLARGPEPFAIEARRDGVYLVSVRSNGAGRYGLAVGTPEPRAQPGPERLRQVLSGYDGLGRPGVAAVVVDSAGWALALGRADALAGTPFTADTRVPVGALAPAFAAHAVTVLADRGRLDLGADVRTVIPGLPAFAEPVTVRDVVTHRAGYWPVDAVASLRVEPTPTTLDGVLAALARQRERVPDDGRGRPNPADTVVLVALVEAVTGRPYADWLRAEVLEPMGLTASSEPSPGVVGYLAVDGELLARPARTEPDAPGQVYASARDLARWLAAVDGSTYGDEVRRATATVARTPQGLVLAGGQFAGGLNVRHEGGRRRWRAEGGTWGGYALAEWYPGEGLGLAMTSNGSTFPAGWGRTSLDGAAGWTVYAAPAARRVRAPIPLPPPPPDGAPADGWGHFTGRFDNDVIGATIEVIETPDGRLAALSGRGPIAGATENVLGTYRQDDGTVLLNGFGALSQVTGRTDADGVLVSLEVHVGGVSFVYDRAAD